MQQFKWRHVVNRMLFATTDIDRNYIKNVESFAEATLLFSIRSIGSNWDENETRVEIFFS